MRINTRLRLLASALTLHVLAKGKWSGDVETRWKPPEGFFEGSAESIAKGLKRASDSLRQSESRLQFYINRAGTNLSSKDKGKLEHAKEILKGLYQ